VEILVEMGPRPCAAINARMAGNGGCKGDSFISSWMSIAAPAKEKVLAELGGKDPQLQQRAAEQASILLSLENLHSFPWIDQRVTAGTLSLHGWYFDLNTGDLLEYQPHLGLFQKTN